MLLAKSTPSQQSMLYQQENREKPIEDYRPSSDRLYINIKDVAWPIQHRNVLLEYCARPHASGGYGLVNWARVNYFISSSLGPPTEPRHALAGVKEVFKISVFKTTQSNRWFIVGLGMEIRKLNNFEIGSVEVPSSYRTVSEYPNIRLRSEVNTAGDKQCVVSFELRKKVMDRAGRGKLPDESQAKCKMDNHLIEVSGPAAYTKTRRFKEGQNTICSRILQKRRQILHNAISRSTLFKHITRATSVCIGRFLSNVSACLESWRIAFYSTAAGIGVPSSRTS